MAFSARQRSKLFGVETEIHFDFREQRGGLEVREVVTRGEYAAGDDVVRRAIDVDAEHLARLGLRTMTRRDVFEDFVEQALLDGEVAEPRGQGHPHHPTEQEVDARGAAIVAI